MTNKIYKCPENSFGREGVSEDIVFDVISPQFPPTSFRKEQSSAITGPDKDIDAGGATCQSVHSNFVRNPVVTASVGKIDKAIQSSDILSRLKVSELNKNRKSANFISTPQVLLVVPD